jgi:acyl-CoA thioester hydrolase
MVTQSDIDELNHVGNIRWLEWAIEGARSHSDSVGLTIQAYLESGGVFVVQKHSIEYLASGYLGDRLELKTFIPDKIEGARSVRKYEFTKLPERKLLVKAETHWVYIDVKSGRPKSIPEEISLKFKA